jgi:hypothetical protein
MDGRRAGPARRGTAGHPWPVRALWLVVLPGGQCAVHRLGLAARRSRPVDAATGLYRYELAWDISQSLAAIGFIGAYSAVERLTSAKNLAEMVCSG